MLPLFCCPTEAEGNISCALGACPFPHIRHAAPMKSAGMGPARLPAMGQQAPAAWDAFITPCFTGAIALVGTRSAPSGTGAQTAQATFFRGKDSPFYQASRY